MIKFIIKAVIVLLALQSAMDYLREQGIIEGSIEINYSVIKQKLLAAVPTKQIATGMVHFAAPAVQNAIVTDLRAEENASFISARNVDRPTFKIIYHIVTEGESLGELAQRYNVHWRVIQKANRMSEDEPLQVGQVLKIPIRNKKYDHYSI
ncbi:MAG: LysM peptidoglycan-binding domain-containing protein [candidate division KSB1 bacterium]|nr:LysM peptidoglycan-binding domain-containing protein [candidate division KSB1 bacterium]MDZ7341057.1 LysM peptidoglycan-binding domain-containing protein [candidate division KSB1 bacterium]